MLREDFLRIPEVKKGMKKNKIKKDDQIEFGNKIIRQGEELFVRRWCGINPANHIKSKEKGLIGNILFVTNDFATIYFPEWAEKYMGHAGWFNIDIRGNNSGWYSSSTDDADFDVLAQIEIKKIDLSKLF